MKSGHRTDKPSLNSDEVSLGQAAQQLGISRDSVDTTANTTQDLVINTKYIVKWFQTTHRGNQHLLANVNQVLANGSIRGCANVGFYGTGNDLPTDAELKGGLIEIHGRWVTIEPSKHWTSAKQTNRFQVEQWRPIALNGRQQAQAPEPPKPRSRRLPATNPTPAPKRKANSKTTARRTQTPKQAIANTNDWYERGGDALPDYLQ